MDNLLKAVYQQFMYVASIYYQQFYSTSAVSIHCKYFHSRPFTFAFKLNKSTSLFLLLTLFACLPSSCHSKLRCKYCRSLLIKLKVDNSKWMYVPGFKCHHKMCSSKIHSGFTATYTVCTNFKCKYSQCSAFARLLVLEHTVSFLNAQLDNPPFCSEK